ncbi:MAG TPA: T9SS type A sorting domain-containing protein, partial [Segetibacter sp.]
SNKPSNFINNSGTPVSSGVNVFPNPAGNTVFVSGKGLPQNKDFIISVISKNGAVLKTIRSNTSNKAVEVNVSSLGAGVYTIKATAGFITINKQFVKQ